MALRGVKPTPIKKRLKLFLYGPNCRQPRLLKSLHIPRGVHENSLPLENPLQSDSLRSFSDIFVFPLT